MSDEYLDVVDAEDEVIGLERRSRIHKLKKRHRAVHIFIFNAKKEMFLQKRSAIKDTSPNLWNSSVSGHVDTGEEYEVAAIREIKEEVGIQEELELKPLLKIHARTETEHEFVWLYRCDYDGEMVLDEEEVAEGKWLMVEDIDDWIRKTPEQFSRPFRFIWSQLRLEGKI
tara:strand:+ start:1171 stop:1680 length:510 start_codon:yes stop_codon:yes gene_type:complete